MHNNFEALWKTYRDQVDKGLLPSLSEQGIIGLRVTGTAMNLAGSQSSSSRHPAITRLLNASSSKEKHLEKDDGMQNTDEKTALKICLEFLEAANSNALGAVNKLIDAGVPINFQNPSNLQTALHITAGANNACRPVIEFLLASGSCDMLLRDDRGLLAADHARYFSSDPIMTERLWDLTLRQIDEQGGDRDTFLTEQLKFIKKWSRENWYGLSADLRAKALEDWDLGA